jgi:hypothetical protein
MSFHLSAVIIVKNEERNIERCIRSVLPVADEVIILDSGSTDHTEAICKRFPVRFFNSSWMGFSGTKNYASSLALYNWVLSIDADEELSPQLQQSILQVKKTTDGATCKISRLPNYCGHWIRHGGWYPDYKTRIFNRNQTRWIGEVHETLEYKTKPDTVVLQGDCYHYTMASISEHLSTINRYSTIWADEKYQQGYQVSYMKMLVSPHLKFVRSYFYKFGFLDGFQGFIIAANTAFSAFLRMVKLKHLYRQNKSY